MAREMAHGMPALRITDLLLATIRPAQPDFHLVSSTDDHFSARGLAFFQGSVKRLHLAIKLALRSFSLMLKLSSRGAMGRVDFRSSEGRSALDVEDEDDVLRALERRRG